MTTGEVLAERYEVIRPLGSGAGGVTWLALDSRSRAEVVVKLLSLRGAADWKSVELFEREAEVLKGLHHRQIPSYVDSFRLDLEGAPTFVLVRSYVEGADLQAQVEGGWRGTEEQISTIGCRLVEVVSYIHSLRPPVIHRDINPRNIVMREDGAVFLVDFGGVQEAIRLSQGAVSTMVGTPGYAPMEQFVGRATVRSDLYGLAATLVFLLTRRSPADLPTRNLRIDLGAVIDIASPGLSRVLTNWLDPDEAGRTLSLVKAEALLSGREAVGEPSPCPPRPEPRPPYGSKIRYAVRDGVHRFTVPYGGSAAVPYGGRGRLGRMGSRRRMGTFGILWLGFVGFWTYSALRMRAPPAFLFVAIPFLVVGLGILRRALSLTLGRLELEIGPRGLSYWRRLLVSSRRRTAPLSDVGDCRWEGSLCLDVGARTLRLGERLSPREQEWLQQSIDAAVRDVNAARP